MEPVTPPSPSARRSSRNERDEDAEAASIPRPNRGEGDTFSTSESMIEIMNDEGDNHSFDGEEDPIPFKFAPTRGNSDRLIFLTLYILLALALAGLAFATTRYFQAKQLSSTTPPQSSSSTTAGDEDEQEFLDRDTDAFRLQLQSVLTQMVKSSELLDPSSPQVQAIDWLVFEDRMLTTADLMLLESETDPFRVYQRYALMTLFFATNGELWDETPWTENGKVHECDFAGIDCDAEEQVVLLDLYKRKLRGRIPDDLGLLTQLTSISLNSNLLEGSIPSLFFERLTKLESLDLSQNEFSSTLSPDIANLTNLKTLALDQLEGVTGPLPESLKTLSNLQRLRMDQNQLTGPIFDFVGHWPDLEMLDISLSLFTGTIPTTIATMKKLKNMKIQNSNVNATNLPSELGLLSNLEIFGIWSMSVDGGRIPTEFGNCENLEILQIQGESFVGEIPSEVGQLTKLERLVLQGGSLSGSVPTELGRLTNLTILSLALNDLTGQLPDELGNLKQLVKLEVQYNDLVGSIPSGMCNDFISIDHSCTITECDCCRSPCRYN